MAILILAIGALSFLYGYVGWKLFVPLDLLQPWKSVSWVLLLVLAMLPLVSMALRFNRFETAANDVVAWLGYVSLGFVSLLFFFLFVKDIFWLTAFLIKKISLFLPGDMIGNTRILTSVDEGRRNFIGSVLNLAILGVAGIMTGVGYVQARHRMKLMRVTVPIKDLPEGLEGLRIVQISDIHVGPTIKRGFIEEIVQRVNNLDPDIIALTGDLVDGSVDYLAKDVEPLADLKAKYGKFFVTGNHEYYSGVQSWLYKVAELGFDVLLNEHKVISRNQADLIIGGVTDFRAKQIVPAHKSDPGASLTGAPPSAIKILLAHQPDSVYEAAEAGYDLQLSGHTHGGQYFPFSKLVKMQQPFLAGLYRHKNTWVYVNRGAGYWGPPMRIGPPAEIAEVIISGKVIEPIEEYV